MICCALFTPFAIWHAQRQNYNLKNKALIIQKNGFVSGLSKTASQAGIELDMSVQGAKSLCFDLEIIESSEQSLEHAWQELLVQLYSFTNQIESKELGVVFLELQASDIKLIEGFFECTIATAKTQAEAHLLALVKDINIVNIANIPIEVLSHLGLQDKNITRLQWLGIKTLGQLKTWSKSQIKLFFCEDYKILLPYLYADSSKISRFQLRETISVSFSFEDAVFEPFRIEPVLENLATKAQLELLDRAANSLNLKVIALGSSFSSSHRSKIPLRNKDSIYRLAKIALDNTAAQGLGIDEIRLELSDIYRPSKQVSLWQRKENKEKAIKKVEARFPNKMLYFRLINPYMPLAEFAYELVSFSGERSSNEKIYFNSRNPSSKTNIRKRSKSLADNR